jgi:hypothetical protein
MPGDSACPELLEKIRQLEEETARLQLLIAELVLKNHHLRRDMRALECAHATGPKGTAVWLKCDVVVR